MACIRRIHAGTTRAGSLATIAEYYFAPARPGLKTYIDRRLEKPDALLFGLALLPKYFAAVRPNTMRIGEHAPLIRDALRLQARVGKAPKTSFSE